MVSLSHCPAQHSRAQQALLLNALSKYLICIVRTPEKEKQLSRCASAAEQLPRAQITATIESPSMRLSIIKQSLMHSDRDATQIDEVDTMFRSEDHSQRTDTFDSISFESLRRGRETYR